MMEKIVSSIDLRNAYSVHEIIKSWETKKPAQIINESALKMLLMLCVYNGVTLI